MTCTIRHETLFCILIIQPAKNLVEGLTCQNMDVICCWFQSDMKICHRELLLFITRITQVKWRCLSCVLDKVTHCSAWKIGRFWLTVVAFYRCLLLFFFFFNTKLILRVSSGSTSNGYNMVPQSWSSDFSVIGTVDSLASSNSFHDVRVKICSYILSRYWGCVCGKPRCCLSNKG